MERSNRSWTRGRLATALTAIAVAGCSSSTAPTDVVWDGTLSALAGSGISGTVGAVGQEGRTAVTIQIRKAMPGETYGWQIDSGSCSGSGQIQGGAALYPDLVADEAGTASAEAGIPGAFDAAADFAARVFGSGGEAVACGDLIPR